MSINETRLDDTINDGLIHLNGYDVLRKDRNRMGGGVAIYFRDNIIIVIIIIIIFIFTQDAHITEVFFSGVLQLYKLH